MSQTETTNQELSAQELEDTHAKENQELSAHEEVSDNPAQIVAGQFGLNGQIFAAQIINFLIVLIILWKFVYNPIVKMLDQRSEKIEQSMKHADEIEKRVALIEKERDQVITQAQKQAQEIIEKAHAQGETRQDEIILAAKREVERVIAKGKDQLADEKTIMIKEMKKEIVDLAMKATTRILRDQVDEVKSKSLAEETIRKLI
ncbi:ATP synthase F0 subunit B [Candidatus Uhrbacteria bacterium RIFOXYA2_FULL_41_8]|nr:MAG: ATP synthase F0 subunit B [Candidatus Uhrbacteria bacterium RIFOXYA2_FULL_41_8]